MIPARRFLIALVAVTVFCSPVFRVQAFGASSASTTGIEGTVSVGPIQGGPSRQGVPDSAPMANMPFVVENAAGLVTTFTTDEHGHFRVALAPGKYTIKIQKPQMKGLGCGLPDIEVTAAGFKKVNLNCDTGMR
jgi:hypothetical protein